MKIYSSIDEFYSLNPCVFTIGIFDGVHIGHKKIIKSFFLKKNKKYSSVLLTFHPHPKEILSQNEKFLYLNTISERIQNLKKTGIKHLIIHPFTKNFSKLDIKDFLQKIIYSKIIIVKLIVGYDFHIGRNRCGTYKEIKKLSHIYGFKLLKIYPYKLKMNIISSTKIRKSLLLGNIDWANKALGYFYTLSGYVVKGKGIGKLIKFPTANLKVNPIKLVPKKGVYAVKIHFLNKIYKGMLNIGINPTISHKEKNIKIEVHIFDFFKNIYGQKIIISIIKIIRKEIKFNSIKQLQYQIKQDKITIERFFLNT
ncbi:bifunctional riboflavin kinase/FAD synthetase [Blattabacterium cuenoti]|uniref:bifunctional riboflavin kinase/FAD synthetase n=1 Tax=Blattabacterium cuenoti TaxID=1653831 RepID=UPI00163CA846|nr:bifunctional riboflavin kinase/FAD synthetase [Blattabacterium cuenoti]